MWNEDDDYDFEYSEDSNSELKVELENQYNNASVHTKQDLERKFEVFWRFQFKVRSGLNRIICEQIK